MNEIDQLLAREKIRTQLSLYCKGIDQRNWDLVRSCFGEGHKHHHGPFDGTLDEFVDFASGALKAIPVSHHSIANLIIEFGDDGKSATSEANFTAVHFIQAGAGAALSFDTGEGDTDWIVAGTYADRWVCVDGQWLIIERNAGHQWERIEPSTKKLST